MNKSKILSIPICFLLAAFWSCSQCSEVEFLSDLKSHRGILRKAFKEAKDEIIIVSSFISDSAIISDNIPTLIKGAQKRGVHVKIYTDYKFDNDNDNDDGKLKKHAEKGRNLLMELYCDFYIVSKVHAKTLVVDNKFIVTGSFNWLSASRDQSYANLEHSILVKNDKEIIRKSKENIISLQVIDNDYRKNYNLIFRNIYSLKKHGEVIDWHGKKINWDDYLGIMGSNKKEYDGIKEWRGYMTTALIQAYEEGYIYDGYGWLSTGCGA